MKTSDNFHNLHFLTDHELESLFKDKRVLERPILAYPQTSFLIINAEMFLCFYGLETNDKPRIIPLPFLSKLPEEYYFALITLAIFEMVISGIISQLDFTYLRDNIKTTEDLIPFFNQFGLNKESFNGFIADIPPMIKLEIPLKK